MTMHKVAPLQMVPTQLKIRHHTRNKIGQILTPQNLLYAFAQALGISGSKINIRISRVHYFIDIGHQLIKKAVYITCATATKFKYTSVIHTINYFIDDI